MRPLYITLFLILGLSFWQIRGFSQTPPQPTISKSSPAALALLDDTIKTLTRPEGVDVQFHQTLFGLSEPATITGKSITAADKRVHIDLKFKQLQRESQLKLLSDGVMFYRLESILDNKTMTSYSIKELQTALDQLATSEAERVAKADVEKDQQGMHGFEGISAMISDLKRKMIFGEPTAASIDLPGKNKQAVKVIEGQWSSETLELIAPNKKTSDPKQQDQRYLWNEKLSFFFVPRQVRLYFDASTGQLVRLELWGIAEKQGPAKLLLKMDILSISPLLSLDKSLFQPTEAELKYKQEKFDLTQAIRYQHQNMMNVLKQQQQLQK